MHTRLEMRLVHTAEDNMETVLIQEAPDLHPKNDKIWMYQNDDPDRLRSPDMNCG